MEAHAHEDQPKLLGYVRAHPWIIAFILGCTVTGAAGAFFLPFLPDGATGFQKAAGGAIGGFYFSLFPIVHRLY